MQGRFQTPKNMITLDDWPETGQLLGLSKQSTYEAARRGEIPTIRIGRRLLVPTAGLRKLLLLDPSTIAPEAA